MIIATIKYSGTFVDRPNIFNINLDESIIAAETSLANGKTKKWTVGELYDIFMNKDSYIKENIDTDDLLTKEHFDLWFRTKYIKNKNYEQRLISLDFKRKL